MASGGNVDGIDSKGRNLLMIAASMGDTRLEVVRLLLAHGAKLETRQYQGITALMFACMTGAQLVVLTLARPAVLVYSNKKPQEAAMRATQWLQFFKKSQNKN